MQTERELSSLKQNTDVANVSRYFSVFSPQPMVTLDGETHTVRFADRAFANLAGLDLSSLIGRTFTEMVPEAASNGCLPLFERVFETGISEKLHEQLHSATPIAYWSYSTWAMPGVDNQTAEIVVQITDSTEIAIFRRQVMAMNEQLLISVTRQHELTEIQEKANRSKDEFLATVSHELRTPLSAIMGWASMLAEPNIDSALLTQGAEVISRNARSQVQIIEDLIDVSRIATGKLRLQLEPLIVDSLVASAVDDLRPEAKARKVDLQLSLGPDAQKIQGDFARLQQVVSNLISNAIKFTPNGGKVTVGVEYLPTCAQITVSDTGKGISPDFLAHVFDRYSQAESSSARTLSGLGIGLSIVRQLVELHGGRVIVDSRGEGLGANFVVTLPLANEDQVKENGSSQKITKKDWPDFTGLYILVVDDLTDQCEMLRVILATCGAQIITAMSAEEALEALAQNVFDILIIDIGMPRSDGYSLIAEIRSLDASQGCHIPAIAVTAYVSEAESTRILRSGFQVYVPKPIDPQEFVAVVANLAGRKG